MDSNRLTEGVIWKKLLRFFFPLVLGSFLQQLYSMADAVIVGQFAGKEALAAVDATSPLIRLFINMFLGISVGATIIISQYYGGERYAKVHKAVHTGMAFALLGGAVVMVAGIFLAEPCLRLMKVPEELLPMTVSYTRIYFAGMIPSLVYNIGAGILRAVGDSRRPFLFLLVSCLVNIGLDYLFVGGFGWGVSGAALATIISQLISAALAVITLMRSQQSFQLFIRKIGIDKTMFKRILRTGLPIALQSMMYPLANILVQSSVNQFGTDSIAGWAVVGKMDVIIWTMLEAFGSAISTFAAQNCGAGRMDRVLKATRIWLVIALGVIGGISVCLYIFARPFGSLFINDAAVIELSTHMMRNIYAPFYIFFVFIDVLAGVIRGTGETFRPMLITLLGICVLRVLWILVVVPLNHTLDTVLVSFPVTWIVTGSAYIIYFLYYRYKHMLPALRKETSR
ncbi:MAG: MATE family efflux transporter [Oscillospiraceae bacterium]